MPLQERAVVNRRCQAVRIPSGEPVIIEKGEVVWITQSLGGSYTLVLNGNLVQIDGKDADAIGREATIHTVEAALTDAEGALHEQVLWDQLKTCYDPEIPVNIVDLGLVYDLQVRALMQGGYRVEVKMTLTAPGCGMGDYIADDARRKLQAVPGVKEVRVDLVWEPLWNKDMMTAAARLELGLL